MFPDFGKLASLLKNAPEMIRQAKQFRGRMDELQEKLGKLRVEGAAGGGMVKVTLNGHQKVIDVTLDPEVVRADDCEMLEDLVAAAVNQAVEKSRAAATEEMSRLMNAGGGLPGGLGAALGGAGFPDLDSLVKDLHASSDDEDEDDEPSELEARMERIADEILRKRSQAVSQDDEDEDEDDEEDDKPPPKRKKSKS